MTDKQTLIDLAARCEAAAGPDRELDEAIAYAVIAGHNSDRSLPFFTASIDAAMTLVPEGWNWMAGNRDQPKARAYVNNGELFYLGAGQRRNPRNQWIECVAATPALALTAAALGARATQEQPNDDR